MLCILTKVTLTRQIHPKLKTIYSDDSYFFFQMILSTLRITELGLECGEDRNLASLASLRSVRPLRRLLSPL